MHMTRKLKPAQAIELVEEAFGYPLRQNKAVVRTLKQQLEDVDPEDLLQEIVDVILAPNVAWAVDGSDELKGLADPDDVQEPSVLAFQLVGLFAAQASPFFTSLEEEYLRVDIGPAGGGSVFLSGKRFGPLAGPVFADLAQALKAEEEFYDLKQLQVVDTDADEQRRRAGAANFVGRYPALAELFWDDLQALGADADLRPNTALAPPGALVCTALSLAACLLGRADGVVIDPGLPELDRSDPASLLVGMLARFAGDPGAGTALAREVVAGKLGVPLTRRWAARLVDGDPVISRLKCV
jgi:hypothetical protein